MSAAGKAGRPQGSGGAAAGGSGPAWRGTGRPAGGGGPSRGWRAGPPAVSDRPGRGTWLRAAAALAAVVLVAAFAYYLFWRPRPTPLILWTPEAYPLQMPPLAFAQEDAELLSRVNPLNVRATAVPLRSRQSLEDLKAALHRAVRGSGPWGWNQPLVLVHVAAHGQLDEQGQACLVPPQADPFDSTTWLPLGALLDTLRELLHSTGQTCLLILDTPRCASAWRCGWLENRWDEGLAAVLAQRADERLFVLTAAGEGEVAWAAPELRSSVFGHFLARALKGEAEPRRGHLSLAGLYEYVATRVEAYVQHRRGLGQRPRLWHKDRLIALDAAGRVPRGALRDQLAGLRVAYVDAARRAAPLDRLSEAADPVAAARRLLGLEAPASGAEAATLAEAWRLYQQRVRPGSAAGPSPAGASGPAFSCDPVAWGSVQQRLAALGERLAAGRQYQGAEMEAAIRQLVAELADDRFWQPRGQVPVYSVGDVPGERGQRHDPAQVATWLQAYAQAEPEQRRGVLPAGLTADGLLAALCGALQQGLVPLDRGVLQRAEELLALLPPEAPDELRVERQMLRLLARRPVADVPAEVGQAWLARRRQAEQVVGSGEVRVHYALERLVNAADLVRRQAEDLWWAGDPPRRAAALLQQAQGSADPPAGYAGAARVGEALREGLQLRDTLWACLPLCSEWALARQQWGLVETGGKLPPLEELIAASLRLDEACQRLLASRDTGEELAGLLARLAEATAEAALRWGQMQDFLRPAYLRSALVERHYARPEDFREAELALHRPPLPGAAPLPVAERYLATLQHWQQQPLELADPTPGRAPNAASPSRSREASAGYQAPRSWLRELHRLLDYEFAIPYAQHRHWTDWDQDVPADLLYRRASQGRSATWQRLRGLLNRYNAEIQRQSPAWSAAVSAWQAAGPLRAWDRQVRVAAAWLACFDRQLARPTQPTPARWLQEYDAAHLASWQAWRLESDFWGEGTDPGPAPPFFARACQQCQRVLPEALRPLRYDLPGGGLASLAACSAASLTLLAQWNPLELAPSLANPDAPRLDARITPRPPEATPPLPDGLATLTLLPHDGPAPARFDLPGAPPAVLVPLPPTEPLATPVQVVHPASPPAAPSAPAVTVQLWFRGHVRRQQAPLPPPGSASFLESVVEQPPLPPPTVEVRGQDTPRGAVLFIFDCSASMQAPGRFEVAQDQLAQVLGELAREGGEALQVGLMVYGRRTKAYGRETDPDLLYRFRSPPEGTPLLTPAGENRRRQLGNEAFFRQFPHPDRDVEELLPVAGGRAEAAQARLLALRKEECQGCTPLYYAITRALEAGFSLPESDPTLRQIVVVSDGVNMPYDSDDSGIREVGLTVNQRDLESLRAALAQRRGRFHVNVVLFGGQLTVVEQSQRRALEALQRDFPDAFEVHYAPDAREIARSLREAFPKSRLELLASRTQSSGQPLAFNTLQPVAGWPTDGLPRRELERRWVRLRTAGDQRTVEAELELRGGERVVLQWQPQSRDARLLFVDDEQLARGSAPASAPSGLADPRDLLVEALDPIRSVGRIERLAFRLRHRQASERFTPRPWAFWVELTPRGAAPTTPPRQAAVDVLWRENINFPRFEIPVKAWSGVSRVQAQVWFRDSLPPPEALLVVARGQAGQTPVRPTPGWRVDQALAEDGSRTISVTWRPPQAKSDPLALLEYVVWPWPPADRVRRRLAQDGSLAIHEFSYTQPSTVAADISLSWVSAEQFRRGAYSANLDFSVEQ